MIFEETTLEGVFIVDVERREDERGFFARTFCQKEFAERGLQPAVAQTNIGYSRRKGTVRGLHFQFLPYAEAKLVRVTRGAIFDVIVDLRPESDTYLQHLVVVLSAHEHRALYVPGRCANGYQTLEDATEFSYQASEFFTPGTEGGLCPLDPRLAVQWPLPVSSMSVKDEAWKRLDEVEPELRRRMAR